MVVLSPTQLRQNHRVLNKDQGWNQLDSPNSMKYDGDNHAEWKWNACTNSSVNTEIGDLTHVDVVF